MLTFTTRPTLGIGAPLAPIPILPLNRRRSLHSWNLTRIWPATSIGALVKLLQGAKDQVVHRKREDALLACEALRRGYCCNPSDGPEPGRRAINSGRRSGTNCRAFREAGDSIFLLFYSSLRPEALLKFKAHNQIAW